MRTMNASRRLVVLCGSIDLLYHIDHLNPLDRPVLLDPLAHTYLAPITLFDPLIHKSENHFKQVKYPHDLHLDIVVGYLDNL